MIAVIKVSIAILELKMTSAPKTVIAALMVIALAAALHPHFLNGQERYPLFEELSKIPVQMPHRTASLDFGTQNDLQDSDAQSELAKEDDVKTDENEAPSPRRLRPRPLGTPTPKKLPNSLFTNRSTFQNWTYGTSGFADYLVPGRLFVSDNNSAETDNRLIFRSSFFDNALNSTLIDGVGTSTNQDNNVTQFLVGFEKTLDAAQQWSLEMRLPLYGSGDAIFANGFSTQNFSTGNVAMILKRQMYQDDFRVISTGVGVSAPTGDDSSFISGQEMFTVKNRATHVAPFIAGLWTPGDKWFYHGFLSVDLAASGNPIEYRDILACGCPGGSLGELQNQTLLNLDFSAGYWWFRGRDEGLISAVSSMFELNYITTLNDADIVSGNTPYNYVEFSSIGGNSFDSINVTAGLDFNILNRLNLRLATVLPIKDGLDRFFDSEWQVSVNLLR